MTKSLDRARKALQAVRQYQQDWLDYGCDRIYQYYETPSEALDIIVGDEIKNNFVGKTIASFTQSDDSITIEFTNSEKIKIVANAIEGYDDEWGKSVPMGVLELVEAS